MSKKTDRRKLKIENSNMLILLIQNKLEETKII